MKELRDNIDDKLKLNQVMNFLTNKTETIIQHTLKQRKDQYRQSIPLIHTATKNLVKQHIHEEKRKSFDGNSSNESQMKVRVDIVRNKIRDLKDEQVSIEEMTIEHIMRRPNQVFIPEEKSEL